MIQRHNVYRANTRLDGIIAVVCLLAAIVVAGLIATDDVQPLSDNNVDATYALPQP